MKLFRTLSLVGLALALGGAARAQEGEAKLVDEVVARVNANVIMRSALQRAQQEMLDELKAQGLKDQDLEKKFNELKPMILDNLIDTELLVQRAKDLSIDVEPQINEQLLRLMKENNLQSLEELEQKMREVGVDINEVRRSLRTRFQFDAVRSREVYGKIYFRLTEKEKRDYYEAHKDLFSVPGEVTLSRIFIATGKNAEQDASAQARAKDLAAQARAGVAPFGTLAERFSESEEAKKRGQIGTLKIPDLATEVQAAVAKAPVGTVTDPIKFDNGYAVFRVDERKEPVVRPFEEAEVQDQVGQRLTFERGAKEFEAFLERARFEAFIEIDPRYQSEASKVKSVQIKRSPYLEEKDKKKKEKEDKKKAKEAEKATSAEPEF